MRARPSVVKHRNTLHEMRSTVLDNEEIDSAPAARLLAGRFHSATNELQPARLTKLVRRDVPISANNAR
jgi:hypothetical protein